MPFDQLVAYTQTWQGLVGRLLRLAHRQLGERDYFRHNGPDAASEEIEIVLERTSSSRPAAILNSACGGCLHLHIRLPLVSLRGDASNMSGLDFETHARQEKKSTGGSCSKKLVLSVFFSLI
jgi:hypothetical protein